MKKLSSVLILLMAFVIIGHAQNKKRVVLQGFWWNFKNNKYPAGWANYLADLAPRMKEIGINAIWVPVSYKNANPASVGYSPFDHYDLGDKFQKGRIKTPFGDKDELLRMVAVLHANGIEVIQDLVLNHIDGAGSGNGVGGVDSAAIVFYNGLRGTNNWGPDPTNGAKNFRYVCYETPATDESTSDYYARKGRWPKNWQNFNPNPADSRYTGSDLSNTMFGPDIAWDNANSIGLSSVSTWNPTEPANYTRDHGREWAIWLKKQTAVDGFRLDAVKHFPSAVAEDYLYNLQNNAGFASGTTEMFAVAEWVGGVSELDAYTNAVQGRAGTFDFGVRGFSGTPGVYGLVYGLGNYDLSNLPSTQQSQRFRTVPFVNSHDTFRPSLPGTGSPGLQANGDYPVDSATGAPKNWWSNSELAPHVDPREPRLAAAYAFVMAVDGNPAVFFEDLFDIGTTGKRYTHNPKDTAELPARKDIADLIFLHNKLDFKGGQYLVPFQSADHLIIERKGKAIIGINDTWTTWKGDWITTSFPGGTKLIDYAGSSGPTDIRTVAADGRVQISTPPCNGSAKRRGYSVWAPIGTDLTIPLNPAAIKTTQEWELANDLGDSNPRSLMQGGEIKAHSKKPQTAGKIYARAGLPITYKLFPSFTTHSITLTLGNVCGQSIDSVEGKGNLSKIFTPSVTGWYVLQARNTSDTNSVGQRVWVNVTYTAPDTLHALASASTLPTYVDLGEDREICQGTTLSALTAQGFTYTWYQDTTRLRNIASFITPTVAGVYKVVKKNTVSGCTASSSVVILSILPNPAAAVLALSHDTIKITNPDTALTYVWTSSGVVLQQSSKPWYVPTRGVTGVYYVKAINRRGCFSISAGLSINSVEPLLTNETVKIYPNPSGGKFEIVLDKLNRAEAAVEIYTMQGTRVWQSKISAGQELYSESLDLGSQPSGLYLVRVSSGTQNRVFKLMLNR